MLVASITGVSAPLHSYSNFALKRPHVEHQEDGATSIGQVDPLGQHVKEASAVLSRLESLGLPNLNISIPRCIVLGECLLTPSLSCTEGIQGQQSTGKSSVIEAISGIKAPRDTGTCTCCPLYITLQPADDVDAKWSAQIYRQIDYEPDPQGPRSESSQIFPGWLPTPSSRQIPFAKTGSEDELERFIRAAQAANLNPFEDPEFFPAVGGYKPRNTSPLKFSPNPVRVEITKPDLPTLSFFDLPGIISQAETEAEDYTVPLVENLVVEYVKQPETLILVTCDLGTDIANSKAAGLARKHKATDRCIGMKHCSRNHA